MPCTPRIRVDTGRGGDFKNGLAIKSEIENFKDRPVTLDIVECVAALRADIGQASGRGPEWELAADTTLHGPPDSEYWDFDRLVLHTDLPTRK